MDIPIAICFFGIVKMHPGIFISIRKKILDVLRKHGLQYHVYLHTYDLKEITNKRTGESMVPLDVNAWKNIQPDYWSVTDQSIFDSTVKLDDYLKISDPWPENKGTSLMNHLRALNSQRMVTHLWNNNKKNYKCVIFLRPDLIYLDPLDMNAVKQVLNMRQNIPIVYTPSWGIPLRGGYNDRLAIGTPKGMWLYGTRFNGARKYSETHPLHSELYLKYVLDNNRVNRKSLEMCATRVRANGWVVDFRDMIYGARAPHSQGLGVQARFIPPPRLPLSASPQQPAISSWSSPQFKNLNVSAWKKK